MEERALRVLEFHQFLLILKEHASSEVGRSFVLSLRPSREKEQIEAHLREAAESMAILEEAGEIPVGGVGEVRPLLARSRTQGACLFPEELLAVRSALEAAGRVKNFLKETAAPSSLLQRWTEEIPDFQDLFGQLNASLGPRGEILDTASEEIRHIRREISRTRSRIRHFLENMLGDESLQKFFREPIITLRNDRYVLPVRSEFKNTFPGIIHDHSQSQATCFIEPLSTVEENNELNILLREEKEEEDRILLALTARVGERGEAIGRAVEILGHLDLVFAKAKYGREVKGTLPLLNQEGHWRLGRARHPLLDSRKAVPIDLNLEPGQTTLIITGANAGGKTVALKTLGLLTVMAQCGIPIPAAEGSEVAVFRRVFADIGDEQSLEHDLSTFSAWVLSASEILQEADEHSLVLLDEAGGGTDPAEGAALTMALLDSLRSRGARTVVTTHLHLLKAYGAIHSDVVNVSTEFNPQTLRSTYRLVYGRPGESYALLMAEKWGFPVELVEKANAYLGEGDRRVGVLLQKLEQTQSEMETRLEEAQRVSGEARTEREKAEALLEEAQKEKEKLQSQAREEALALVRQARESLRDLINEFKARGRTDHHRLAQAIQAEEERIHRLAPSPSLDQGVGRRTAAAEKESAGDRRPAIHYEIPTAARKINVIGLRVDEALPLVDKAIDKAFLGGLRELEIIHGAGTGRLRKAIREHLVEHELVQGFMPAGPGRGGDGVTVVEVAEARSTPQSARRPGRASTKRG